MLGTLFGRPLCQPTSRVPIRCLKLTVYHDGFSATDDLHIYKPQLCPDVGGTSSPTSTPPTQTCLGGTPCLERTLPRPPYPLARKDCCAASFCSQTHRRRPTVARSTSAEVPRRDSSRNLHLGPSLFPHLLLLPLSVSQLHIPPHGDTHSASSTFYAV